MPPPPFESIDVYKEFLTQSSLASFRETISRFSSSELISSLPLLDLQIALEAQNKLDAIFQYINTTASLEELGKALTPNLFISFLNFVIDRPEDHKLLNPLLIGLSPQIFSTSLHYLQRKHLEILKLEGVHEPLCYQLTQFIHEGKDLKNEMNKEAELYNLAILSTNPTELIDSSLHSLTHQIELMKNRLVNYLERASTALAIVWHTDRIDLIEKLSAMNEFIQHQLIHLIGHPPFDSLAPTGLYLSLEKALSSIFSQLLDDDSAIEGMTRLGIWELKDYWEMGLLSSLERAPENLTSSTDGKGAVKPWDNHQDLILFVQQQLERVGIEKVKDLKKLHLFSKSLFKGYIEKHRKFLGTIPT